MLSRRRKATIPLLHFLLGTDGQKQISFGAAVLPCDMSLLFERVVFRNRTFFACRAVTISVPAVLAY